jgi:hypothetical protein
LTFVPIRTDKPHFRRSATTWLTIRTDSPACFRLTLSIRPIDYHNGLIGPVGLRFLLVKVDGGKAALRRQLFGPASIHGTASAQPRGRLRKLVHNARDICKWTIARDPHFALAYDHVAAKLGAYRKRRPK